MRVIFLSFSRVDQEEGVVVTRTVTIDGNRQAQPAQSEVIRHTTMPTEIITKTITIEGDGGPLTAEELKEIMAQQGANFDTEVITTVCFFFPIVLCGFFDSQSGVQLELSFNSLCAQMFTKKLLSGFEL